MAQSNHTYYYVEHPSHPNTYVLSFDGNYEGYSDDLAFTLRSGEPTAVFKLDILSTTYTFVCPRTQLERGGFKVVIEKLLYAPVKIGNEIKGVSLIYSQNDTVNAMARLLQCLGFYPTCSSRSCDSDLSTLYCPVYNYGMNGGCTLYVSFNTNKLIKEGLFDKLPEDLRELFPTRPLEVQKIYKQPEHEDLVFERNGRLCVKLYHNGCYVTYHVADYLVSNGIGIHGLRFEALNNIGNSIIERIESSGKKYKKTLVRKVRYSFSDSVWDRDRKLRSLAELSCECLRLQIMI